MRNSNLYPVEDFVCENVKSSINLIWHRFFWLLDKFLNLATFLEDNDTILGWIIYFSYLNMNCNMILLFMRNSISALNKSFKQNITHTHWSTFKLEYIYHFHLKLGLLFFRCPSMLKQHIKQKRKLKNLTTIVPSFLCALWNSSSSVKG